VTVLADQHQRDRIVVDGLDETLFVEAGAGSGKTSNLVERVVNLVLTGRVRLRDVAAITFTEAAASELRDRIRVAFEREVLNATGERRQRASAAVDEADQAAISTLHGFARRILAEHPLAAKLPPRITIVDEITSQISFEQRWARFVDAIYANPLYTLLLERAALCRIPLEPRYPNQVTLKDVAAVLTQGWDRLESIARRPVEPLGAVDFAPFDAAVADLDDVRDTCRDDSDKLYEHIGALLPEMKAIAAVLDPDHKLALLANVGSDGWRPSSFGTVAAWGCPGKDVREYIKAVSAAGARIVEGVADQVLRRLCILIATEVLDAAEARRRDGALEFHDLLVLARRVLRDSDAARHALHDRYRCLLLDEFQDTDPIQIDLAVLIAGAIEGDRAAEWSQVAVEPGRLFFVGDPKQSIYRFRRADIALFLNARDRFGADDRLVRLTTNFRTVEPIVTWVNALFGQLMADEKVGSQPRYVPLVAHRTPQPGCDHRPVRLGGPHDEARAAELREAEAADVAGVVSQVRSHPGDWPVFDTVSREWRPARLTDVTILVPTRTSVPYLGAALDAAGVPYRLDTGTLVFDTQEVRDVLAAVRAVDDPTDELSVVAALRSPLYGCSDADLFDFREAGGRWNPSAPPPAGADRQPVAAAIAHLHELWLDRWWSRPSDVVERIVRERQAMLAAFGDERPREVWRRLRFLVDQARAFDDAGGGGLRAFTEWAELQQSGGSRVHEPLLAETDDHAVRVMTIHGAKGLEFPITILSGMTTKPTGRRTGAKVLWIDDEPAIRIGSKQVTDNFDPRAEIEDDMDADEKLRLLYVAATRARDHLVVSCHHRARPGGGDGSYGHLMWDLLGDDDRSLSLWRDFDTPVHSPPPAPARSPAAIEDDRDAWISARRELLATAGRRRVMSATAIAAASVAGPEQLELALDGSDVAAGVAIVDRPGSAPIGDEPHSDPDASADEPRAWRRGRAGTAIGRAVHATLQSVALTIDIDDPVIDGIGEREATLEAVPEAADTVAAMVRSALASDAVSLARRFPHHKELYVAAPVGDRVVEGYVDLLVETADGLVVVDYKTDTVASEAEVDAKLGRYELQGAAYAVALEVTTGESVVECRFVFCRPRGAIERSIADLAAARRNVLQAGLQTSS